MICGAWRERAARVVGQLSCNETCAMEERNRKLANAFGISVPTEGGDGGDDAYLAGLLAAGEGSDYVLRFAARNPAIARGVEKQLAAFINDNSSRVFYFPVHKPFINSFIAQLADEFYSLFSEIVDSERKKPSVIIRKKVEKTPCIPKKLVSEIASNYKPEMTGSSGASLTLLQQQCKSGSVLETNITATGPLIDGLVIRGVKVPMDEIDVKLQVEPMLSNFCKFQVVHKQDISSFFVLVEMADFVKEEVYKLVMEKVVEEIRVKFVELNEWAGEVVGLVKFDQGGNEVIEGEESVDSISQKRSRRRRGKRGFFYESNEAGVLENSIAENPFSALGLGE